MTLEVLTHGKRVTCSCYYNTVLRKVKSLGLIGVTPRGHRACTYATAKKAASSKRKFVTEHFLIFSHQQIQVKKC